MHSLAANHLTVSQLSAGLALNGCDLHTYVSIRAMQGTGSLTTSSSIFGLVEEELETHPLAAHDVIVCAHAETKPNTIN